MELVMEERVQGTFAFASHRSLCFPFLFFVSIYFVSLPTYIPSCFQFYISLHFSTTLHRFLNKTTLSIFLILFPLFSQFLFLLLFSFYLSTYIFLYINYLSLFPFCYFLFFPCFLHKFVILLGFSYLFVAIASFLRFTTFRYFFVFVASLPGVVFFLFIFPCNFHSVFLTAFGSTKLRCFLSPPSLYTSFLCPTPDRRDIMLTKEIIEAVVGRNTQRNCIITSRLHNHFRSLKRDHPVQRCFLLETISSPI